MYLSKLLLNPDPRCRSVLRDLADPYEMHRTVLRAFPDRSSGGPGRVLFRLEPPRPDHPPTVLVQSDKTPDWSPLTDRNGYLLESPQFKPYRPAFRREQRLRFRLRANPTVKRDGKRHGLIRGEQQLAWLGRKAKVGGFTLLQVRTSRQARRLSRKASPQGGVRQAVHLGVDFEGILQVTDPDAFLAALAGGIGPAKAFGCGLLSVAPVTA